MRATPEPASWRSPDWDVARPLPPSYFGRGLAETSTAIYAEFVPVPEIESGRLRLAFGPTRSSCPTHWTKCAPNWRRPPSRGGSVHLSSRSASCGKPTRPCGVRSSTRRTFQRKVPESDGFLTPLKKWRKPAGWGGQPGRVGEWALGGCRGRLRRGGEGGVSLPCRKSTQHTTQGDKER